MTTKPELCASCAEGVRPCLRAHYEINRGPCLGRLRDWEAGFAAAVSVEPGRRLPAWQPHEFDGWETEAGPLSLEIGSERVNGVYGWRVVSVADDQVSGLEMTREGCERGAVIAARRVLLDALAKLGVVVSLEALGRGHGPFEPGQEVSATVVVPRKGEP